MRENKITRRDLLRKLALVPIGALGAISAYFFLSNDLLSLRSTSTPDESTQISESLYPGDETLPDLSQVTFDHLDANGEPIKFLWGVATSSYQMEGNISTNDWDFFTNSELIRAKVEAISRLGNADVRLDAPGVALDHWDLSVLEQDLERAAQLGVNAYRLSLEWSRIQPNRPSSLYPAVPNNVSDFDTGAITHYQDMLAMIRDKGMEPILTLNHVTLPKWVLTPTVSSSDNQDFLASLQGWENQMCVDAYVKFVQFIVPKFMGTVNYWITLNEPTGVMGLGYLAGVWSPGFLLAGERARKVFFNLIEAHVRGYDVIKELAGAGAKVGFAHAMIFPKVDSNPNLLGSNAEATVQFDYCFNRYFLEAVIHGVENKQISRNNQETQVRDDWKGRLDFIGINYYGPAYVFHDELFSLAASWAGGRYNSSEDTGKNLLTELGGEIYPVGLYKFLKYLDTAFHLPILITENGISVASDPILSSQTNEPGTRGPYIVAHLEQVLHAISEGVNVVGYIYWTLLDSWEWSYDYTSSFGLFSVNRQIPSVAQSSQGEPLFPRTKTQGAEALQYIIELGKVGAAPQLFGTVSPSGSMITRGS